MQQKALVQELSSFTKKKSIAIHTIKSYAGYPTAKLNVWTRNMKLYPDKPWIRITAFGMDKTFFNAAIETIKVTRNTQTLFIQISKSSRLIYLDLSPSTSQSSDRTQLVQLRILLLLPFYFTSFCVASFKGVGVGRHHKAGRDIILNPFIILVGQTETRILLSF